MRPKSPVAFKKRSAIAQERSPLRRISPPTFYFSDSLACTTCALSRPVATAPHCGGENHSSFRRQESDRAAQSKPVERRCRRATGLRRRKSLSQPGRQRTERLLEFPAALFVAQEPP